MALNSASCAAEIAEKYKAIQQQTTGDVGTWAADFANAYHSYAEAGVIAGAVSGGGDKAIIQNAIENTTSSSATIIILANAFASYWAGVGLTPASPNIASANNAASLVGAFAAAITSIITDSDSKPYFKNLIDATERVAKTIVWTITPPPPDNPFTSAVV